MAKPFDAWVAGLALSSGLLLSATMPCDAGPSPSSAPAPIAGGPSVECAAAVAVLRTIPGIGIDPHLWDDAGASVDCTRAFKAAGITLKPVDPSDKTGIYFTLSRPVETDRQVSMDLTTLGVFPRVKTYWLDSRGGHWLVVRSETEIMS